MRTLAGVLLISAAAAPAMAAEAPPAAPMSEPPPRMVVQSAGQIRRDRTAQPPAMGQSTHAIMMPGQEMPRPAPPRRVRATRPRPPS